MSACVTSNNKSKKEVSPLVSTEYLFDLSLHTKLFLQELDKEIASKKDGNFIPSEEFIEKYNIQKIEGDYSISGFIKVDGNFREADLVSLNIKMGSKAGEIMTIIIPLEKMAKFLELKGIKYFEINKKASIKTK
ncbi:MAG: hypothetical protein DRI74_06235 [Bacteroidetes bacterium]|nr:MAG: hypothetical protein DRI74_06235 [Bacteroidota bacterium]